MALTEKVKLQAQAGQLGVEGYRTMSLEQLKEAIKNAQGAGSASAKGKTAVANGNGSKGKTAATQVVKGKTAVPAPAKGKTQVSAAPAKGKTAKASTSAPAAESTRGKTAPRAQAPKGKVERPTTGGSKGKTTTTANKGKTASAAKAPARRTQSAARGTVESFKATINNKEIDWKAESTVGHEGKRKDVLDALRKFKGDKAKVFELLRDNAVKWYPNALNSYPNAPNKKHAAERMLVWLIGKVAYDFVKKTGQHQDGVRAGYRQSTNPRHIKRRESREAAAKARGTTTGPKRSVSTARKPPQPPKPKPAARKPATAVRGKPAATQGKGKQTMRGKR